MQLQNECPKKGWERSTEGLWKPVGGEPDQETGCCTAAGRLRAKMTDAALWMIDWYA